MDSESDSPDPAPAPASGAGAPASEPWWTGLTWWEAALWAAGFGVIFWQIISSLANLG